MCCFSGVEGLAGLGDQLASQMSYPENLKIHNPDSVGVEFIPLHTEGTSSVSKKDNVVCILKWKSSFFILLFFLKKHTWFSFHTVKCIDLKCTAQWVLANMYTPPHQDKEPFHHSRKFLMPLPSESPFSLSLEKYHSDVFFHQFSFASSKTSYK